MQGIVTISRYIREKLTAFDPSLARRVSIVYYGIDLGKFRPGSVPAGVLRGVSDSPGHASPGNGRDLWKNQIEFLDALVEIRKEFTDAATCLSPQRPASGR